MQTVKPNIRSNVLDAFCISLPYMNMGIDDATTKLPSTGQIKTKNSTNIYQFLATLLTDGMLLYNCAFRMPLRIVVR